MKSIVSPSLFITSGLPTLSPKHIISCTHTNTIPSPRLKDRSIQSIGQKKRRRYRAPRRLVHVPTQSLNEARNKMLNWPKARDPRAGINLLKKPAGRSYIYFSERTTPHRTASLVKRPGLCICMHNKSAMCNSRAQSYSLAPPLSLWPQDIREFRCKRIAKYKSNRRELRLEVRAKIRGGYPFHGTE